MKTCLSHATQMRMRAPASERSVIHFIAFHASARMYCKSNSGVREIPFTLNISNACMQFMLS